jgi:hypothetical protein
MDLSRHVAAVARRGGAHAWAGHGLALLSAVMRLGASVGRLSGEPSVIGERTGLGEESAVAPALASLLGVYKWLLDLWPLPLALWAALRRDAATAALVWAVAVVVIPLADLAVHAMTGRDLADAVVHLPFLVTMCGAAAAYAMAVQRAGLAKQGADAGLVGRADIAGVAVAIPTGQAG